MNDRYLYRAKRTDNGEWVIGLPGYDIDGNITEIEVYRGHEDCVTYEVDPSTFCQCVGIKDKNGKLMWENDIIRHEISDTIGTVKWCEEDYVGWCVDDVMIDEQQFTGEMWSECVVIGNVFDNPELLEEG